MWYDELSLKGRRALSCEIEQVFVFEIVRGRFEILLKSIRFAKTVAAILIALEHKIDLAVRNNLETGKAIDNQ